MKELLWCEGTSNSQLRWSHYVCMYVYPSSFACVTSQVSRSAFGDNMYVRHLGWYVGVQSSGTLSVKACDRKPFQLIYELAWGGRKIPKYVNAGVAETTLSKLDPY